MKRSNRFLVSALAVSLSLHAIVILLAGNIKTSQADAVETPPPFTITQMPAPTPTPVPPTPQPIARPHRVEPRAPAIKVVKLAKPTMPGKAVAVEPPVIPGPPDNGNGGTGDATAGPDITAPPGPACSQPDIAARTTTTISPDVPDSSDFSGATSAQVKVTLSDTGAVTAVSILQSSGDIQLDAAAERAARESSYAPETRDCQPIGGDYIFRVDFER
jgi:TonB family protein